MAEAKPMKSPQHGYLLKHKQETRPYMRNSRQLSDAESRSILQEKAHLLVIQHQAVSPENTTHTYAHNTETPTINFKENKEEYMTVFGRRKEKGEII